MTGETQVVRLRGERLTLGRSNVNDVVLDDPNVSRFHAAVVATGGVLELRDLDSRCGTRLNGRPVKRSVIRDGAEIGIGSYRLRFDGSSFVGEDQRGALRLVARDVSVRVDDKRILNRVSLSVEPGELVAIIGGSGSGKSTLIKALAGVSRPSKGSVTLNGEPVTARATDVGYVPQEEIVHRLLTVGEALGYAARLRLPHDSEPATVRDTIERVLAELSLGRQSGTRIDALSGGERKRASVASELLHRPSLLFLDEPTTGLDPGLESDLMRLFRDLAEPGVRSVVVVTHATRNLALCDKLAVIGRGGELAFFGTPADALGFFGVASYDEVYGALQATPAADWRKRYEAAVPPAGDEAPPAGPAGSPRARQRAAPQLSLLTARYVKLLMRDGRNLLILLGQVPLIAFALAFLFKAGVFNRGGAAFGEPAGRPDEGVLLLFLLVTTAIWLGSIDGSREIVKERAIAEREANAGVRRGPYLASKALVLCGLAALQTLALSFFVFAVRPLDESVGAYALVIALLVLTSWTAVGLGLLVSAASSSEDQATSFLPLILIPQLLFAGAIVPVARMAEPISSLSLAVFARWSLAGTGSAIGMDERLAADPKVAAGAGYGKSFFDLVPGLAAVILAGFLALLLAGTAAVLARRRG